MIFTVVIRKDGHTIGGGVDFGPRSAHKADAYAQEHIERGYDVEYQMWDPAGKREQINRFWSRSLQAWVTIPA